MYTDNSFPLFESIMHGSLDPLATAMAACSNYEQRILDQIVDAEKDNGIYSISFVAGRHLKEKYYRIYNIRNGLRTARTMAWKY